MQAISKPYPLFAMIQWWLDLIEADWQREPSRQ